MPARGGGAGSERFARGGEIGTGYRTFVRYSRRFPSLRRGGGDALPHIRWSATRAREASAGGSAQKSKFMSASASRAGFLHPRLASGGQRSVAAVRKRYPPASGAQRSARAVPQPPSNLLSAPRPEAHVRRRKAEGVACEFRTKRGRQWRPLPSQDCLSRRPPRPSAADPPGDSSRTSLWTSWRSHRKSWHKRHRRSRSPGRGSGTG